MKDSSRRTFVKQTAATGLTFTFAGLIRAHGQTGGNTTWNETTYATSWNQEGTYVETTDPYSEVTTTWDGDIFSTTEPEYATTTAPVTKVEWFLICISDPASKPDNPELEKQLRDLAKLLAGVFGQENTVGNFIQDKQTGFDPPGVSGQDQNWLECHISAMGPLKGAIAKSMTCQSLGYTNLQEYNSSKNAIYNTLTITTNKPPYDPGVALSPIYVNMESCSLSISIDDNGDVTTVPDNGKKSKEAEVLTSKGLTKCVLEISSAFVASAVGTHDFRDAYAHTGGTQGVGVVTAETVLDWNNLGKITAKAADQVWGIRKLKVTTVYSNNEIVSTNNETLNL